MKAFTRDNGFIKKQFSWQEDGSSNNGVETPHGEVNGNYMAKSNLSDESVDIFSNNINNIENNYIIQNNLYRDASTVFSWKTVYSLNITGIDNVDLFLKENPSLSLIDKESLSYKDRDTKNLNFIREDFLNE